MPPGFLAEIYFQVAIWVIYKAAFSNSSRWDMVSSTNRDLSIFVYFRASKQLRERRCQGLRCDPMFKLTGNLLFVSQMLSEDTELQVRDKGFYYNSKQHEYDVGTGYLCQQFPWRWQKMAYVFTEHPVSLIHSRRTLILGNLLLFH